MTTIRTTAERNWSSLALGFVAFVLLLSAAFVITDGTTQSAGAWNPPTGSASGATCEGGVRSIPLTWEVVNEENGNDRSPATVKTNWVDPNFFTTDFVPQPLPNSQRATAHAESTVPADFEGEVKLNLTMYWSGRDGSDQKDLTIKVYVKKCEPVVTTTTTVVTTTTTIPTTTTSTTTTTAPSTTTTTAPSTTTTQPSTTTTQPTTTTTAPSTTTSTVPATTTTTVPSTTSTVPETTTTTVRESTTTTSAVPSTTTSSPPETTTTVVTGEAPPPAKTEGDLPVTGSNTPVLVGAAFILIAVGAAVASVAKWSRV